MEILVAFVFIILSGLIVGYASQIIVERFKQARQAALADGLDTSVDKNVTLVPSYRFPWPHPNMKAILFAFASVVVLGATYFVFQGLPMWGLLMVLGSIFFLILLFVVDASSYRLPFPLSLGLLLWQAVCLAGVGATSGNWEVVQYAAVGAAIYAGFLFLIFLGSGGNLGFGDVVLAVPLGVLLGAPAVDTLSAASNALYALLLGSVLMVGVFTVLHLKNGREGRERAKKESVRRYVPFGPNLIAGAYIFLLITF